jgi:(p)ppGpp synthase/HD superfamily hydrolase
MQRDLGPKVREAYLLAAAVHAGQTRQSGEAFLVHPLAVAELLFSIGADADVVSAALLHDALEDGVDAAAIEVEIFDRLGDHVLYLVHAVSKDGRIPDPADRFNCYLEQMTKAFQLDIFVFFLKAADLVHNLSTIAALPQARQGRWLRELQAEYLPLFSEFYHQIPLRYRAAYHRLLDRLQGLIASHEPYGFAPSADAADAPDARFL